MCIRHYELALKYEGEYKATREMRKHASWYIKGLPKCTEVRDTMNRLDNSKDVMKVLIDYKNSFK